MKDISIFVSSTFADMQSERDLLRERILPELEEHVKKYGVNINFIDLRWDIDTTNVSDEESTNIIIKACVDEIIESKPYFISLVGERYGWIPELKYIENALYALDIFDAKGFEDISITEFEIRVAEYLGKADMRSLYFLRKPVDYGGDTESRNKFVSDDADDRARIDALKKHIRASFPDRTFDYGAQWSAGEKRIVGLDAFCEQAVANLKKLIDADFAEERTAENWIEEFESFQESYIASRNAVFRGREKEIADILARLDKSGRAFLVSGESGNGKSSLVAKLAERLTDRGEVYSFFTGVHRNATNIRAALRCFIHEMTGEYTDLDFDGTVKEFYLAIKNLAADKKHYFIIDAINQMDCDTELESLGWLRTRLFPENVKLIISTTNDFSLKKKLANVCDSEIKLGGLAGGDVAAISEAYFKKNRKSAPKSVIDAIVAKNSEVKGRSPLFLKFILNKVINLSGADFARIEELKKTYAPVDAIMLHIRNMIESIPLTLRECYADLIDGMRGQFPADFADAALILIAYSQYGFSERNFELVVKKLGISYNGADFAYLVKLLREFLFGRSFVYDFNHGRVKDIVRGIYSDSPFAQKVFRTTLDILEEGGAFDAEFIAKEYLNYAMLCSDYDGYAAYLQNNADNADVIKEFVAAFNDKRNLARFDSLAHEMSDYSLVLSLISKNRFGTETTKEIATALLNTVYERGDNGNPENAQKIYDIYMTLGGYFYNSGRYSEALNLYLLLRKFVEKTPCLKDGAFALNVEIGRAALKTGSFFAMTSVGKRLDYSVATTEEKLRAQAVMTEISGRLSNYGRTPIIGRRAAKKLAENSESMAEIISDLPYPDAVKWFGTLCEFATLNKTALGGEKINALAAKLESGITRDMTGATLARELSDFYFATDRKRSKGFSALALEISGEKEIAASDISGLAERYRILVQSESFVHKDKNKYAATLREELEILEAVSNVHYVYAVFEAMSRVKRELKKYDKHEGGGRRKTFVNMLSLSRGLKTPQSRQVNKVLEIIIVIFLLGYLIAPMVLFLIWGDHFAYILGEGDSAELVYSTLDNAFQTVYSIAFCAAYFGIMYVLQRRNSFLEKREWSVKLAVLIVFLAVLDFGYYRFSVFMYLLYRTDNYILKHYIMFKYVLAVGFTLVLDLLYEGYLFYKDELRARSEKEKYEHYVRGFKRYAADAGIRFGCIAANVGIFAALMQYTTKLYGYKNAWTSAVGVVPSVIAFAAVAAAIAAFIVARLIYSFIVKKRLEKAVKYE